MMETLIQYALLALGLAATLVLFVTFKRELYRIASQQDDKIAAVETRLKEADAESERDSALSVESPRSAFNFNRRTQALRLLRRGEDIGHVAAALGVPRTEIELLVRVEKLHAARTA